MNMNEIEEKILSGINKSDVPMMYAQGYGRSIGIILGMVERMSQQDRDEFAQRLDEFAQFWGKKVEESIT